MIKIVSSEKGKQCDQLPYGSVHKDASKVPSNFQFEDFEGPIMMCTECRLDFDHTTPFVKSNQTGDNDMCIRCYEKKYVIGRDDYKEAIRTELLQELIRNNHENIINHLSL